MPTRRQDFTQIEKDGLAKRAAYICSNPDCRALTVGPGAVPGTVAMTGNAAHITGASEGGPRYDSGLSSEERASTVSNGIWLCRACHSLVDGNGGAGYPADLLREWRRLHDEWVGRNLNQRIGRERVGLRNSGDARVTRGTFGNTLDVGIDNSGRLVVDDSTVN